MAKKMHIKLINRGEEGELLLEGRLDSAAAPEVEEIVLQMVDRFDKIILNMAQMEYISSAGLRVLLGAQKKMQKVGSMKVIHVCEAVMEVFEMTGFADILVIE